MEGKMKHLKTILNRFFAIFFVMLALAVIAEDLIYRLTPTNVWFEYYGEKVVPVPQPNGEVRFSSNSLYKRDARVEWYDTLYCEKVGSGIYRGDTQYFSDYKVAGSASDPGATWGYNYFPDPSLVTSCYMSGRIVAYTPGTIFQPNGHEKVDFYQTTEFPY